MARWTAVALLSAAVTTVGAAAEREPAPDDPVFVAVYTPGSAFLKGKDVAEQPQFREHVEHLRSRSQWLIAGGPFASQPNDQAVGLVVFQAVDEADARRWISADPVVVAGVFKAKVRLWRVRNVRALRPTEAR